MRVMTLSKMMLLTFVEAKSILLHKALFPNKDLKVSACFFLAGTNFKWAFLKQSSPIATGSFSGLLNFFGALLGDSLQQEKDANRVRVVWIIKKGLYIIEEGFKDLDGFGFHGDPIGGFEAMILS